MFPAESFAELQEYLVDCLVCVRTEENTLVALDKNKAQGTQCLCFAGSRWSPKIEYLLGEDLRYGFPLVGIEAMQELSRDESGACSSPILLKCIPTFVNFLFTQSRRSRAERLADDLRPLDEGSIQGHASCDGLTHKLSSAGFLPRQS
jgi:hypothetical protein